MPGIALLQSINNIVETDTIVNVFQLESNENGTERLRTELSKIQIDGGVTRSTASQALKNFHDTIGPGDPSNGLQSSLASDEIFLYIPKKALYDGSQRADVEIGYGGSTVLADDSLQADVEIGVVGSTLTSQTAPSNTIKLGKPHQTALHGDYKHKGCTASRMWLKVLIAWMVATNEGGNYSVEKTTEAVSATSTYEIRFGTHLVKVVNVRSGSFLLGTDRFLGMYPLLVKIGVDLYILIWVKHKAVESSSVRVCIQSAMEVDRAKALAMLDGLKVFEEIV